MECEIARQQQETVNISKQLMSRKQETWTVNEDTGCLSKCFSLANNSAKEPVGGEDTGLCMWSQGLGVGLDQRRDKAAPSSTSAVATGTREEVLASS